MRFYLLFILLLIAPVQVSAFYKCVDESGAVTYQKIPCGQTSTQRKMHVYVAPTPGEILEMEFADDDSRASEVTMHIKPNLSTIISSLAPVRMALQEYHQANGEWPEALEDIDMNDEEMRSNYIDAVVLDSGGRLVARLNRGFGKNKQLIAEPKSVMGGTSYEWSCYANFPRKLLASGGNALCESRVIN